MKNQTFYILLLFMLTGLSAHGQSAVTFSNRLSAGLENDSNVNESTDSAKTAQSLMLTAHSLFSTTLSPLRLQVNYSGAFQHYGPQAANKIIHEPKARLEWRLHRKLYLGMQEYMRYKSFQGNSKDYHIVYHQPFIQYYLTSSLYLQFQFQRQILDYSTLSYFNFKANQNALSLGWWMNDAFKITGKIWQKSTYYSRDILTLEEEENPRQIDINTGGALGIDWTTCRVLLTLLYSFEQANSNQYGFDYSRHAISFVGGILFDQFYFTTMLSWQIKDYAYSDDLNPVYWDSETNENNQLVFEFSRDLTNCCTAALRLGWYRNESVFANLYYDKFLMTFKIITRLN